MWRKSMILDAKYRGIIRTLLVSDVSMIEGDPERIRLLLCENRHPFRYSKLEKNCVRVFFLFFFPLYSQYRNRY